MNTFIKNNIFRLIIKTVFKVNVKKMKNKKNQKSKKLTPIIFLNNLIEKMIKLVLKREIL